MFTFATCIKEEIKVLLSEAVWLIFAALHHFFSYFFSHLYGFWLKLCVNSCQLNKADLLSAKRKRKRRILKGWVRLDHKGHASN